jgi:hypothetical protein
MLRHLLRSFFSAVSFSAFALAASATTVPITADTYFTSSAPTTNYGGASALAVNSASSTLLQITTGAVPPNVTGGNIQRATLVLFQNQLNTAGTFKVSRITSSWTEAGSNYGNRPSVDTATAITFNAVQAQKFVSIDVTPIVQYWFTNPGTNFGIEISSTGGDVLFDSKENSLTGHVAMLDISLAYTGATGATGAPGAMGPAGLNGAPGAPGAMGATGPTGAAGLTGSTGATGVTYLGAYSAATTYGATSVVLYNNALYIHNNPVVSTGVDPTTTGYWTLLLPQGATGPTGADSTVAGPSGPSGPAGATGATGTFSVTQSNQLTAATAKLQNFNGYSGAVGLTSLAGSNPYNGSSAGNNCGNGEFSIGQIVLTSFNFPFDMPADGRLLPIQQYQVLFALIGTTYGGNGTTNFAVPDMRAITPAGMIYSICTSGIFPSRP